MKTTNLIEPDLDFIRSVMETGGQDVKKCYQCATCSTVCPISPELKPFPRKEMIAASWGLKKQLLHDADIWLCHNCGDCSTECPRDAKPADVMSELRRQAIIEYAWPKPFATFLSEPKNLPWVLMIPVLLFILIGLPTGLLDFTPEGTQIVHAHFFSTWLVDIVMIPAAAWAFLCIAVGVKRFVHDIHGTALLEGKTIQKTLIMKKLYASFISVLPEIFKHQRFSRCEENQERSTLHMMVMFSYIGLFFVTSVFFVALYVFHNHGPYSQMNPVKWIANVSGAALIIGSGLLIRDRFSKRQQQISTYFDWCLAWLVFGIGVTGMATQMARLMGLAVTTYTTYFIHLILVFCSFAYLPYTKFAHIVFRTVAMTYVKYAGRNFNFDHYD
ncbi:MAG: quinone-interacting membrane-bound oxidoreductase complex subunit QmoC [Proteobacteria bacterium]|nr:quinone-interacting membrane-bound oxidoreductase complex subunit QmoC [Pseudomonadota bacterium]MBU1542426.1 quinone-interacting membrane-bound oxidoreductase complex subunit QmoC [Pseudomonadota bacterium]MBU2431364.1 quinone-interacting membrane-bound oxidoreductase complex subunit QmoC [Pseudomonadota bacterium]MBU2482802.1 quinone-interacting membrane-bound oxidoreductase complex subunit QmoC [Pseudomonadota bacterium]